VKNGLKLILRPSKKATKSPVSQTMGFNIAIAGPNKSRAKLR